MPNSAGPRRFAWLIRGRSARLVPGRMRRLLGVNAAPHPGWLDLRPNSLAVLSKGGVVWLVATAVAGLLGVQGSGKVIRGLVPALAAATLAQYPLKALFHRPRPLNARVRQAVFRRPRKVGASFPSGDAAATFAGAWLLGRAWPRWALPGLALAGLLAAGRVAVGVHRPVDIAGGAALGVAIAEAAHRATFR